MLQIHYNELLKYIHPGDCFYYKGDKYFIFLAKAPEGTYISSLWNRLKYCWNILKQ